MLSPSWKRNPIIDPFAFKISKISVHIKLSLSSYLYLCRYRIMHLYNGLRASCGRKTMEKTKKKKWHGDRERQFHYTGALGTANAYPIFYTYLYISYINLYIFSFMFFFFFYHSHVILLRYSGIGYR